MISRLGIACYKEVHHLSGSDSRITEVIAETLDAIESEDCGCEVHRVQWLYVEKEGEVGYLAAKPEVGIFRLG